MSCVAVRFVQGYRVVANYYSFNTGTLCCEIKDAVSSFKRFAWQHIQIYSVTRPGMLFSCVLADVLESVFDSGAVSSPRKQKQKERFASG
jgi:hypothetical protein